MYFREIVALACGNHYARRMVEYCSESSDGDSVAKVDEKSIENSSTILDLDSNILINFVTLRKFIESRMVCSCCFSNVDIFI